MQQPHVHRITMLALLLALQAPGCADIPYVAPQAQSVREKQDSQTGSNLARRDKPGANVQVIDKDAMEAALRGTNANRDNGR